MKNKKKRVSRNQRVKADSKSFMNSLLQAVSIQIVAKTISNEITPFVDVIIEIVKSIL